jgi:hypothetical protein
MADHCPEGHYLRNGDRILSQCWACADDELRATGATYWADRGIEPSPHELPTAERRRRFAQETP